MNAGALAVGRAVVLLGLGFAAVAAPAELRGQAHEARAEGFVPAGHWTRDAVRRLGGLGLVEARAVAAAWPLPRSRVRGLLESAAEAAAGAGGRTAELADFYLDRFRAEFPDPAVSAGPVAWSAGAGAGWLAERGVMRGGASGWIDDVGWVYGGPVRVADGSDPRMAGGVDAGFGRRLAVSASLANDGESSRAEDVYGTVRLGGAYVWAGRRGLSLGPAGERGIVLADGATRFHGVGLEVPGGRPLPSLLERLGPATGAFLFARLERSGPIARPWFWAGRVSVSPHPDLALGINRAAIFGGEGNEPVTLRSIAYMLVGLTDTEAKSSEFENQVASVDAVWRTRVGGTPVVVYGEWGLEDMGGAWRRVPGILAGLELPAVPGLAGVAAGLESAVFARSRGGNPPWYRHGPLGEGWTDRGRLLGHPLGGHGTEWALHARWTAPGRGTELDVRTFIRNRGTENLYSPDRIGSGHGAALRAAAMAVARFRLLLRLEWEAGRSDWSRWSAHGGLQTSF